MQLLITVCVSFFILLYIEGRSVPYQSDNLPNDGVEYTYGEILKILGEPHAQILSVQPAILVYDYHETTPPTGAGGGFGSFVGGIGPSTNETGSRGICSNAIKTLCIPNG